MNTLFNDTPTAIMLTYNNDFVIVAENAENAAEILNWYSGIDGKNSIYVYTAADFEPAPVECNFIGGYAPSDYYNMKNAISDGRAWITRGL